MSVGNQIYIADGQLVCDVTNIEGDHIVVTVKNNFRLGELQVVNLPSAIIELPTVTEKDEQDITDFGVKFGLDAIAVSFVRKATDIEYVKSLLSPKDGARMKIFAKIMNHEGLHNYDEILQEADGIIICRADLGMEIPPEKVFIAQKWMVEKANLAAKPVIMANQMLESMIKAPRPSRAEASEIATCILDGVDAFLLNNETAQGDYPINAVNILSKCCAEAEKTIDYKKIFSDLKLYSPAPYGTAEAVAAAAVASVIDLKLDLIIVVTETGRMGRLVSKYKPEVPILVASENDYVVRQMLMQRGIQGIKVASNNADNIAKSLL